MRHVNMTTNGQLVTIVFGVADVWGVINNQPDICASQKMAYGMR